VGQRIASPSADDRERWSAVDAYFTEALVPIDVAAGALERSALARLPHHQVSRLQGQLLRLLVEMSGAHSVLEIGTLGAYSTVWLASGLAPGGRVVTLERSPEHAAAARASVADAGLTDVIVIREGAAVDTLAALEREGEGPFDFVFIDADKASNDAYLAWALRLTRPGSVIVADNVVRDGAVVDAESTDPSVRGVRRFTELVAGEPRLRATAIQTVGEKGYDGLVLARVVA